MNHADQKRNMYIHTYVCTYALVITRTIIQREMDAVRVRELRGAVFMRFKLNTIKDLLRIVFNTSRTAAGRLRVKAAVRGAWRLNIRREPDRRLRIRRVTVVRRFYYGGSNDIFSTSGKINIVCVCLR